MGRVAVVGRYSRVEQLRDQIWIGLNTGLSITPYWGSDTGGFTPRADGRAYALVSVLGVQRFVPLARAHLAPAHPWGWGLSEMGFGRAKDVPAQKEMNNPAIEPVAKKYAERYRSCHTPTRLPARPTTRGCP